MTCIAGENDVRESNNEASKRNIHGSPCSRENFTEKSAELVLRSKVVTFLGISFFFQELE